MGFCLELFPMVNTLACSRSITKVCQEPSDHLTPLLNGRNSKFMKIRHSTVIIGVSLIAVFAVALIWVFGLQPLMWPSVNEVITRQWGDVAVIVTIAALALILPGYARAVRVARQQHVEDYLRVARDVAGAGEATLVEALDAIPEGFVIYDAEGRLVRCNAKFREIYSYSESEAALGVTHEQLGLLDERRGVRVVGETGEEGFLQQRLKYRSRLQGEQLVKLPDGRLISTRERPLARGGFVSIQADITELKETQERLRKSEQLLLDAIEALDEGFIFYDENERLVIANSTYKKMYPAQKNITPGISIEDAIRLSVYAGEIPAAIGSEEEWIANRVEQHRSSEGIIEQALFDGRWAKVSERRTADGGVVGIRTDITELKDSKALAESANRAKTSFLAHMSHELRTPLNSIIGYSDMIRHETFGPVGNQKYTEYLDNIYNSGALLLALINDILDISRVEIGEMEASPEMVDPLKVIASCAEMMKPKADYKNLKLTIESSPFDSKLLVDLRHLQQILINLIGNSIKFTTGGGGVSVRLNEVVDVGVEIVVSDSGCGIATNEIDKVFMPFSQVGDAFSQASEGTGLGLYLVKNLAELNGASVNLESELNVGTSVTISFPQNHIID